MKKHLQNKVKQLYFFVPFVLFKSIVLQGSCLEQDVEAASTAIRCVDDTTPNTRAQAHAPRPTRAAPALQIRRHTRKLACTHPHRANKTNTNKRRSASSCSPISLRKYTRVQKKYTYKHTLQKKYINTNTRTHTHTHTKTYT